MDMKKSFGVDEEAQEKGKWFDLEDEGRVLVAALGNPLFNAEVQRLSKPHYALLKSNMDTNDLLNKITIAAMAKTILLDWKEISIDGVELEYSTEKAEELLTNFKYFRDTISELSAERKNFLPSNLAEK